LKDFDANLKSFLVAEKFEYRISNPPEAEISKDGIARAACRSVFYYYKKKKEYLNSTFRIPHSTFNIRLSLLT